MLQGKYVGFKGFHKIFIVSSIRIFRQLFRFLLLSIYYSSHRLKNLSQIVIIVFFFTSILDLFLNIYLFYFTFPLHSVLCFLYPFYVDCKQNIICPSLGKSSFGTFVSVRSSHWYLSTPSSILCSAYDHYFFNVFVLLICSYYKL